MEKDYEKRKFVKKVKRKIPWIEQLIENYRDALDINIVYPEINIRSRNLNLCIYCRGAHNLCGKARCPITIKLYSYLKTKARICGSNIEGSSPPGVFVGRYGYPNVQMGPLVPPIIGDTEVYDYPEKWLEMNLEDIVDMRLQLIRSKFQVNVKKMEEADKILELTQEIALAQRPVNAEIQFTKPPGSRIMVDDEIEPMGPSAPINRIIISSNVNVNPIIEKAYYDYDLKASEAIMKLFKYDIPVSSIQRVLSVGVLGVKRDRKIVPTRWSITAVDSMISRRLRDEKIKKNPLINEYRVYESELLGNKFLVIMFPDTWQYEFMEAWYPGTAWNPDRNMIAIGGDYEPYKGRTTYAQIGGCYYAARLATTEYLEREGRQASILIFREAYPEYILPLGVWVVREGLRKAYKNKPLKFNTLEETLKYVSTRLKTEMKYWIEESKLLENYIKQKRILDYITRKF